jgi:cell wall-associated NlpC family hydrolase
MPDSGQAQAARMLGGKLPRNRLLALVGLVAAVAVLTVVLLSKGGDEHASAPAVATKRPAASGASTATARGTRVAPTAGGAKGAHGTVRSARAPGPKRVNVAEAADPEEASSFPASGAVHHKAASAPSKASEQVVAAGAPSNAEVEHELAQMKAAERSAKAQQKLELTPVKGGNSVGGNGTIPIPANVPEVVQRVIAGANAITDFPYVFGGGHASFVDNAYDCSGSVSYALAAGGLLSAPETSGELESWGVPGPGRYITVYAAAGHTYMYVDGVLYDTAGRSGPYASRWQVSPTDNSGYVVRHWPGL